MGGCRLSPLMGNHPVDWDNNRMSTSEYSEGPGGLLFPWSIDGSKAMMPWDASLDTLPSLLPITETSALPTHYTPTFPLSPLSIFSEPSLENHCLLHHSTEMARIQYVPARNAGKQNATKPGASPPSELPASSSITTASNESTQHSPPSNSSPTNVSADSLPRSKALDLDFAKKEAAWAKSVARRDVLLQRPPKNHTYLDKKGVFKDDGRFEQPKTAHSRTEFKRRRKLRKAHPKVAAAKANGTVFDELESYYAPFEFSSHKGGVVWHHVPLAGTPRAVCFFASIWQALTRTQLITEPGVSGAQVSRWTEDQETCVSLSFISCRIRNQPSTEDMLTYLSRRMLSTPDHQSSSQWLIT
jgi:hypothetical protein